MLQRRKLDLRHRQAPSACRAVIRAGQLDAAERLRHVWRGAWGSVRSSWLPASAENCYTELEFLA
jgi:hypothetical protein